MSTTTLNIGRFEKRPVQVEAVLVTEENLKEVAAWCKGVVYATGVEASSPGDWQVKDAHIDVYTTAGRERADIGDVIVKAGDSASDFYPLKSDAFESDYRYLGSVSDPAQPELDLDI